jgi:YVTN family beta-propeller protein
VNARTNELITRLKVGAGPVAIALSPDGRLAWVAKVHGASVSEIAVNDLKVIRTIPVGNAPAAVAVTQDGRLLLVANAGDGTLSIIDLFRHLSTVVPVGANPQEIQIPADGRLVFVVNVGDATVSAVNLDLRQVVSTIRGR